MTALQRRVSFVVVVCALVGAAGVLHLGAQGWATSVPAQPAWVDGLFYRPLTIFSRGGRVTAVTGVPSDPQMYYMGAAGGVFKTTDAGATWQPVTDGQIGVGSIGAIAVAESNPEHRLRRHRDPPDPRGNVSNGDGVYKSTDAGKTWTHIGLDEGRPHRPHPHPSAESGHRRTSRCSATSSEPNKERGVYRTKDGGKTWEQVLSVSEQHRRDRSLDGPEESERRSSRRCGPCAASPGRSTRAARKAACSARPTAAITGRSSRTACRPR